MPLVEVSFLPIGMKAIIPGWLELSKRILLYGLSFLKSLMWRPKLVPKEMKTGQKLTLWWRKLEMKMMKMIPELEAAMEGTQGEEKIGKCSKPEGD
jgi:hypothetical protein